MGEKPFFSVISMFKLPAAKKSSRDDLPQHEPVHPRRLRPSDEDRGRYVGEPDIDWKADIFIAKFHEARVMDPERQTAKYHEARVIDSEAGTANHRGSLNY